MSLNDGMTDGHHQNQPHEMIIRVRYAECDPMGVAHHSAYAPWFEMGRTELLRSDGISYRDLEESGTRLAVVELGIKYRRPAKYDDVLRVLTTLTEASHVKIKHTYELWRGENEKLATAHTTLACLDLNGRAVELPDLIRQHAQKRMGTAAATSSQFTNSCG